ncbi:MAG: 1-deoxy-D-xylulose-5-phosphate synthase [Planctomycetota bacterium]|nr:1-deoxy-D-xylulose-5-phosphate synthase [Planctomycetota bacterium]
MSIDQGIVMGGKAGSADELLKTAAHRAAEALGAQAADIPCEIAEPFLAHIKGHDEVKRIPMALLPKLAQEIRNKIHETIQQTPGHYASNLGIVELTVALHRVFDFRRDRLVLDVGHQGYPHKMLTGRAHLFHTLRQENGLCGYPHPKECPEYDLFNTSHAGCAVSSVLGLAVADRKLERDTNLVAVVGDGAMTTGITYEALNNAGHLKENMIVILNDNGCSISVNTGALSATCSAIRKSGMFNSVRSKGRELIEKIPYVGRDVEKFAANVFGAASHLTHSPGAIFLDLGFKYYGPVDGHDFHALHEWLEFLKHEKGPKLLHVITQKGRGFAWSETDPVTWHGAKPYEVKEDGTAVFKKSSKPKPPDYYQVVSSAVVEAAKQDEKILGITAAMEEGTGLAKFHKEIPERFFDVGICEQHAVAFAAALAKGGMKPVACIYSSFLQRAMDQLMHEISLQDGLPVVVCMDRAGLVGDDGPTANGVFDLAYMRALPHFVLMAPKDGQEATEMVHWAVKQNLAIGIRTPKESVPSEPFTKEFRPLELGKGEIVRQGEKVAFLAYGAMVAQSMKAAEILEKQHGLKVTVANARFCKPLDGELVEQLMKTHDRVITAEDHQLMNGFGSAVLEECCNRGLDTRKVVRVGIPDQFIAHGARPWQLKQCGMDPDTLVALALK